MEQLNIYTHLEIFGYMRHAKGANFILKTIEPTPRFTLAVYPEFEIQDFFDENFAMHLIFERGYVAIQEKKIVEKTNVRAVLTKLGDASLVGTKE